MKPFKSSLLTILQERGFIYQGTDLEGLDEACAQGSIKGYIGFDATATSLHVGSLTVLMIARWLQHEGHIPIILMGGGTTKIGDPSGRDTTRQMLSDEDIAHNIKMIKGCIEKLISFEKGKAILVDNAQWLDTLLYIPFLRDIGVHFSVNRMLSMESVKARLDRDQPLTFIEFNYSLLQAYDFLELFQKHDCILQFGGSDQWGNILPGVDLVRRITGKNVYGMTCPLLTTATGSKMGKTAQGAVWIDETRLSAYDYWQFWRNTDDRDVVKFLKLYTMLPLFEIARFEKLEGRDLIEAKVLLADEATALIHGKSCLSEIHSAVEQTFSQGVVPEDLEKLLTQLPVFKMVSHFLKEGVSLLEILESLKFVQSKSEGRQKIREKAISLNHEVITQETYRVTSKDFESHRILKISLGQKKHGLIVRE